jgi:hypothetical protein
MDTISVKGILLVGKEHEKKIKKIEQEKQKGVHGHKGDAVERKLDDEQQSIDTMNKELNTKRENEEKEERKSGGRREEAENENTQTESIFVQNLIPLEPRGEDGPIHQHDHNAVHRPNLEGCHTNARQNTASRREHAAQKKKSARKLLQKSH